MLVRTTAWLSSGNFTELLNMVDIHFRSILSQTKIKNRKWNSTSFIVFVSGFQKKNVHMHRKENVHLGINYTCHRIILFIATSKQ